MATATTIPAVLVLPNENSMSTRRVISAAIDLLHQAENVDMDDCIQTIGDLEIMLAKIK